MSILIKGLTNDSKRQYIPKNEVKNIVHEMNRTLKIFTSTDAIIIRGVEYDVAEEFMIAYDLHNKKEMQLHAEIDYLYYLLGNYLKFSSKKKLTPIEIIIDDSMIGEPPLEAEAD